jgi:superfamily I DNA/RNA helicase
VRESWWKKQAELDDAQKNVITLPKNGLYLLTGPPGSGKTNLLLLRAMFLSSSGLKDVLFLTVGRTLQEFIVTGLGSKGLVANDQVLTFRKWTMKHLGEHSAQFMRQPPIGTYDEKRAAYAAELIRVNKKLPALYNAILVDEVQDLNAQELEALNMLTTKMMVAGDDRQQIYGGGEGIAAAVSLKFQALALEYHYRIGKKICEAADAVFPPPPGQKPLVQMCNYNENLIPSSTRIVSENSFEKQIQSALKEIRVQLKAFPGEAIGILAPRREHLSKIRAALESSDVADLIAYHDPDSGGSREFPADKQIFVMTVHSSKGTEFRAVHIVGAERLRSPVATRRTVFTAFTRAKTSLAVYYTGTVAAYIQGAFSSPSTPKLDELFP